MKRRSSKLEGDSLVRFNKGLNYENYNNYHITYLFIFNGLQ